MAANSASIYLKYANLQMAAESLFGIPRASVPGAVSTTMTADTLQSGNGRASRFTTVLAQQFIDDGWTVVENKSNTTTGFSGTLFKYVGQSDPARGLTNGELALSFRSTEFVDDAARDNEATNKLEIRPYGWAFGQMSDMMSWYDSLVASGKIGPSDKFAVTGYSLGGHLAQAFNRIMLDRGDQSRITATYTFNGAGSGTVNAGHRLSDIVNSFTAQRNADNSAMFTTSAARDLYVKWRSQINGDASDATMSTALNEVMAANEKLLTSQANATAKAELKQLQDGISRARQVLDEAGYIRSAA